MDYITRAYIHKYYTIQNQTYIAVKSLGLYDIKAALVDGSRHVDK